MMPRVRIEQTDFDAHVQKNDPILFEVVRQIGPFRLILERNRFQMLVRSIISQQLSTAAAKTIRKRLESQVAPSRVTANSISRLNNKNELISVGLSRQNAEYISDLSGKVLDGTLKLSSLGRKSDESWSFALRIEWPYKQ